MILPASESGGRDSRSAIARISRPPATFSRATFSGDRPTSAGRFSPTGSKGGSPERDEGLLSRAGSRLAIQFLDLLRLSYPASSFFKSSNEVIGALQVRSRHTYAVSL